jgi:hypothetical protein
MRRQISIRLKIRSQTIRSAIKTYNKAASELSPPRSRIEPSSVLDMAFLSQFDLLRYSQHNHDIRSKPWADPATRVLTDKYFELKRANEEILRLNLEWRRVHTWLLDEEKLFLRSVKCLSLSGNQLLSDMVHMRWKEVQHTHRVIWRWLYRAQSLPFFSADLSHGNALRKERVNEDLLDALLLAGDEEMEEINDNQLSDGDDDEDYNINDMVSQPGCLGEQSVFDSFVDSVGRMCV